MNLNDVFRDFELKYVAIICNFLKFGSIRISQIQQHFNVSNHYYEPTTFLRLISR